MDLVDLAYAGIARQAELIASGELSARDLVEVYLERIARLDPQLKSFRVVFAERARLEAAQADARRGAGERAQLERERPLLGVPIAIKEDADVAGELTSFGTGVVSSPASADSEVVRRLRAAGAIVIGKTSVPELTLWPFTETPTFGATRNPWNVQYTPGGSSGGSGAAVAAGLAGGALGSDGLGSIRIPASFCGLYGIKPQRDRIAIAPHDSGARYGWYGLAVYGPLTHTVADAALFLDATAQTPPAEGTFREAADHKRCGRELFPSQDVILLHYLHGQFARRNQHEGRNSRRILRQEPFNYGNQECQRFAGSCLCGREDVLAFHGLGNRRGLHGRRH